MIKKYWIIALICLGAYGISLNDSFMLDDYLVLFNESGVSNKSFLNLFTEYQHIVYRPVGHLPLWIFYQCFGAHAIFYHIVNLLLFIVVCILFCRITKLLTGNRSLAFLVAILYALHPANSMLVNYVTANILSVFIIAMQVSFLFVIYYLNTSQKRFLCFSYLFFLLSCFSHEMSIIFPAFVFCLVYFLRGFDFKKAMFFIIPYGILTGLFLYFRTIFFTLKGSASAISSMLQIVDVYISSIMTLIYWYVGKMMIPRDIVFLWTAVIEEHYNPIEIYRSLALLAFLVYLILFRWKKGIKPFALSVFIIGFVPVFGASYAHFPFAEPMIEPHWFYFSSLGFFILLAVGLLWLKTKINITFWRVCVGTLMVVYFILLQQNNWYWRNQESYCRFWITTNGVNTTPYYGMGQVLLNRGDYKEAIGYLGRGFTLSRRYQSSFLTADVGYAYLKSGDPVVASQYLNMAVIREPNYSVSYYYLGLLAWGQGEKAVAEQFFLKAIQRYPKNKYYREELGRIQAVSDPIGKYPLFQL